MSKAAPNWLRQHLEVADLARISTTTVSVSPDKNVGLDDLLEAWRGHLSKLESDLLIDPNDRSTWGAHDYIAALIIRDHVAQGMALLSPELKANVELLVRDLDNRFRNYSEPDPEGFTERVDGRNKSDREWWWSRIPKHGPVRDEMFTYYRSESSDGFRPP